MDNKYLEIFTLDDELPVFGPLDGGFRPAIELALELRIIFFMRNDTLRSFYIFRRHLDL